MLEKVCKQPSMARVHLLVLAISITCIFGFMLFGIRDAVLINVKKAQGEMDKGVYDKAIRYYESALEEWKHDKKYPFSHEQIERECSIARVHGALSKAQHEFSLKRYEEAMALYERALSYWLEGVNYGVGKSDIERGLLHTMLDLTLVRAERAVNEGDFERSISLLLQARNLAPGHAGVLALQQVISEKWEDQGRILLRAAARSLDDYSLMQAKQELDRASVLIPDSEQVAFLQERLSAKEQEVRLFGDKPAPTGEVVPAVVKYFSSVYPTEKIRWHGSRSVLHDHRGTLYWLVQVSYTLGTSPGEVRDEVAYIYQGEVAFMRDLHTGKLLYAHPEKLVASSSRHAGHYHGDVRHSLFRLIDRVFDITSMYSVGSLSLSDADTVFLDGEAYYKVLDARFPFYEDFEYYIKTTYVPDLAQRLLENRHYVNINGRLYCRGGDRGSSYLANMYRMRVVESTEAHIKVEIHIPSIWDDDDDQVATLEFSLISGQWLVSNQQLAL